MPKTFLENRIIVKSGDITKEKTDAIVNAANSSLMGGGGVDGAIHRAGGKEILEECMKIRQTQYPDGLPTGEAVITTAGNLPAKYIIHTVGPIWGASQDNEKEMLRNCYRNSLYTAAKNDCKTIAFPAISTGIYGFPRELAAEIASNTLEAYLQNHDEIKQVVLVFFSAQDEKIFLDHCQF